MTCRRKPCCLLLSPGAIKTWPCISIHLGPVLGSELSQSVQHSLKIKPHPSRTRRLWTVTQPLSRCTSSLLPSQPITRLERRAMLLRVRLAEVASIHRGEPLLVFCVAFFPPRTANTSSNNGSSREEAFEWPFPAGAWARQKQLLNSALMYLACPGLMFVFISDKLLRVSLNVSSR